MNISSCIRDKHLTILHTCYVAKDVVIKAELLKTFHIN